MTTLLRLIEKSGLNRNQVSKISGISNTYLAKLEQFERDGARIDIRRKTLIAIAISLNLGILEINELLKEYGHGELSTSDTPYFLDASETQNITGILPLFSSLAREWFLLGMEKKLSRIDGASVVYVLDQPSHVFKSPEHASYLAHTQGLPPQVSAAYKDLVASACLHRRNVLTEALERGNLIKTYICAGCLESYAGRWEKYKGTDIEEIYKTFLRQHFENLIQYIETYPDQYQLKLLKKCSRIKYQALYLPAPDKQGGVETKISQIFFHAQETECGIDSKMLGGIPLPGSGQGFGDLIGFATDLQNLLDFFHKQHIGLTENFIDTRFDTPQTVVNHLKAIISTHILKK